MRFTLFSALLASGASVLADPSISEFTDSLTLSSSFDPVKAAYWTGLPHHRRTPFAVSPDGKSAYIAYLTSAYNSVVVQQVDTTTFTAVGTAVEISNAYEAAGLVAQNDGFALMATVNATGTTDLPPTGDTIVTLIRYKSGAESWRTALNGPGVHASDGLTATPDANGDLVYSEAAGLYGAYFVVTAYTGYASGHFGDSIQYINDAGALVTASSSAFGCSHNTGIGIEAADAVPFATVCAEDHGAIWLNTETQYMSGIKIANENTTTGVSGEPMGGMSGSYSNIANFPGTTNYVFAWQSRGALNLYTDTWMGAPNTQCEPRWLNHNVAIATMSNKNKLTGAEAISTVGAASGDDQVNWITKSTTDDHQNVHVGALSSTLSLVSWETLTSPTCQAVPLSCSGTFAGTSFQVVDATGSKVGAAVTSTNVTVSGDMALVGSKLCWPYVSETWDLSVPKDTGTLTTKMSFACVSIDGTASSSKAVASSAPAAAVTPSASAAVVLSTASVVVPVTASSAAVVNSTQVAVASSSEVLFTTSAESVTIPTSLPATTAAASLSSAEVLFTTSADSVTIATSLPATTEAESSPVAVTSSGSVPIPSASSVEALSTTSTPSVAIATSAPTFTESAYGDATSISSSASLTEASTVSTSTRSKHHGHTGKHSHGTGLPNGGKGYAWPTTFATFVRPTAFPTGWFQG